MERLTSAKTWEEASRDLTNEPGYSYIWQRLQQYEDTGLEPEEINALCEMDRRAKMAEMLRLEESAGVSIDRLAELAQADRDGRCWAFPCKVYDDVYINFWGRTLQATIVSISQIASTPNFRAMIGYQLCYIFKMDDIGKTVFLTHEEAEAALKEREKE